MTAKKARCEAIPYCDKPGIVGLSFFGTPEWSFQIDHFCGDHLAAAVEARVAMFDTSVNTYSQEPSPVTVWPPMPDLPAYVSAADRSAEPVA